MTATATGDMPPACSNMPCTVGGAGRQPRSLPCLMSSDVFDVAAIDANIVQFVVAQL